MSNWQVFRDDEWTQSSFVVPVPAPNVEPDAEPMVCVGFNASWLPYVMGALFQLQQQGTWDPTSTGADVASVQAQRLMQMVGDAMACCMLRWSDADCALEISTDGGATWAAISGWDINGLAACLQQPLIDIGGAPGSGAGGPPNPGGVSTAQMACNIANWLAVEILQGSMSSMASSLGADATTLEAALGLFGLAASFTGVGALFFEAAGIFVAAATAIGETALNTAASDSTLRADITCAIYSAISADGHVTPGNFAAIVTNINAISYGIPGIVGLIKDYVSHLGYNGINAIQAEGVLYGGLCPSCAGPVGDAAVCGSSTVVATCGSDVSPGTGPFTLGLWIANLASNQGYWQSGYNHSGGFDLLALYAASSHFQVDIRTSSGGGDHVYDGGPLPSGTAPHLFVVTSTGAAGSIRIYIDGVDSGGGTMPTGSIGDAGAVAQMMSVGGATDSTQCQWQVAYYNTAMTAPQVAAWFAAGSSWPPPGGAQHFWPYDEGSGSTLHDTIGHNDATLSGAYTWGTHT